MVWEDGKRMEDGRVQVVVVAVLVRLVIHLVIIQKILGREQEYHMVVTVVLVYNLILQVYQHIMLVVEVVVFIIIKHLDILV